MMAIDFFKSINDQYGHKVGDWVLQKLAGVCKNELRVINFIGGEEFAILMPEMPSSNALGVAERIRRH
jgi:diguanylate cyclase (GGDEF)-like protein